MWIVLLQNVWVRRALLLVAVAIALFGVREHYVHMGERRGAANEQVKSATEGESARTEERKDAVSEIAALKTELIALERGSAAAMATAKQAGESAQQFAARQEQARAQVESAPTASLHTINLQALGGASGAVYDAEQEREIASCLAQRPLCEKRAGALEDANRALQQAIADAVQARELQQRQYESLSAYTGQLERHYTALYNNVPRRRNWTVSVITLGLRGKSKKLAVPKLEELKSGAIQEAH
jgi:hypothetical protein